MYRYVAGALLAVVSVAIGVVGYGWRGASQDISLVSETIPLLEPHGHGSLDSILDGNHGRVVRIAQPSVLEEDLWIAGFKWEVENARQETLHHVILTRNDRSAVLCPNGFSEKEELFAAGSDTFANEFRFPEPYGIFLPKGTPLSLEAVVHNPYPPIGPGGTYTDVRVKLTLFARESGKEYRQIRMVRLSLENPACTSRSSTFDVPAQTYRFEQTTASPMSSYTFTEPGTILFMGAHTHPWEGGEKVTAYLNDSVLREFIPRRKTADPWSWAMPASIERTRVQPGDTIRLSATYTNTEDEPLEKSAMGMIMFAFSPE